MNNGEVQRVVEVSAGTKLRSVLELALGLNPATELSDSSIYNSNLFNFLDSEVASSIDSNSCCGRDGALVMSLPQCLDTLWDPVLPDPRPTAYLSAHSNLDRSLMYWKYRNICANFFQGQAKYSKHAFLCIRPFQQSTEDKSDRTLNNNKSDCKQIDSLILRQIALEVCFTVTLRKGCTNSSLDID